jgi:gas vesicle protein
VIETNIFEQWLDAEARRVGQKLANNENLTPDDKLTIVLKGLTNHVAHLNVDLRGEIAAVSTKLSEETTSLREQISSVRTELKVEISSVRTELKTEISSVRTELKTEISELRTDVNRRFEKLEADVKDVRKEVIDIHKALNGQVWKIVGALSLLGTAAGAVSYFLKLWR